MFTKFLHLLKLPMALVLIELSISLMKVIATCTYIYKNGKKGEQQLYCNLILTIGSSFKTCLESPPALKHYFNLLLGKRGSFVGQF